MLWISTIVNFLQLNENDNVMLVAIYAESILLVDSNWKLITGFSFLNENILQGQMFFVWVISILKMEAHLQSDYGQHNSL